MSGRHSMKTALYVLLAVTLFTLLLTCGLSYRKYRSVPPNPLPTQHSTPQAAATDQTRGAYPYPTGKLVRVPDLVGQRADQATDYLRHGDFWQIEYRSVSPDNKTVVLLHNWVVVAQDPTAGTEITPTTVIYLYGQKR